MSEIFHLKYRPTNFDEVIGQNSVVSSLKELFKSKNTPHSFLFVGPSGVGKTTIARIIASQVGCDSFNIIEVDAATHTGVDSMRELTENVKFQGIGNPNKVVIIDEGHMLSKGAWNSLLKIIEEPPEHLYFIFCTTEGKKVPETIRTRCNTYLLKEVSKGDIELLLEVVVDCEKLILPEGTIGIISKEALGSVRRALVYLSQVVGSTTLREVLDKINTIAEEDDKVLGICRLIASGRLPWKKATEFALSVKESNLEGVRIQISNYLASCVVRSNSEKDSIRFLSLLGLFSKPWTYQSSAFPELLLVLGEIVYGGESS